MMVHRAGLEPADTRFLAGQVFQFHHLCIKYALWDLNPCPLIKSQMLYQLS